MYKKPLNARAHVHKMEIALKDGHCKVCPHESMAYCVTYVNSGFTVDAAPALV